MQRPRGLRLIPISLIFIVLLSGCGSDSPMGPVEELPGLPRSLSPSEALLIEAGNDFAFRFMEELQESDPASNLFASPFSASMALGMTMNGAQGSTYDQMREMLGFGAISLGEINQGYRDLLELLTDLDPSVQMGVGNSIWYREGFPVRSDFLDRTRNFFDAEVREMDFSDPKAPGIINGWVREKTNGKITEIIDDGIDAATVMFLINATYFKGMWTHRFEKNKTAQAEFTREDGTKGTVPLMELSDTLRYAETELYKAVDLPYGGGAFSMTVLLPQEGHSVQELVASMNPQSWEGMVESLHEMPGTVHLPRFRMEWERVLNETLQRMGMLDAFSPGLADFSGLSDIARQVGLFVSKVKQKSYVDVDEEGTEAAAATIVEIRLTAAPNQFSFRADRPFLFVIRERFSNTILFAGVFMTPPSA